MGLPTPALAALTANDVTFAADELANATRADALTHLNDLTAKLMADNPGRLNALLAKCIPMVDVEVGPTNGAADDPNFYMPRANCREDLPVS